MNTENQTPDTGQLKRIDFQNGGRFEANGTFYQVESSLSIERYCELQLLEKEMAFGTTFRSLFANLRAVYVDLNKADFVGAAVKVDSMLRGIAKVEEREPVVMKICALFINADNENRKEWSADLSMKKINDWKAAGIDAQDFFTVALNSASGFIKIYSQLSQAISGGTLHDFLTEGPKD